MSALNQLNDIYHRSSRQDPDRLSARKNNIAILTEMHRRLMAGEPINRLHKAKLADMITVFELQLDDFADEPTLSELARDMTRTLRKSEIHEIAAAGDHIASMINELTGPGTRFRLYVNNSEKNGRRLRQTDKDFKVFTCIGRIFAALKGQNSPLFSGLARRFISDAYKQGESIKGIWDNRLAHEKYDDRLDAGRITRIAGQ